MATPANYIKIELKEAKPTSVILTGTRADATSSSTATLTLTSTETAVAAIITMEAGESEKDYVVSGLTPETTYTITGTGQYDSGGSVSSVTTIADTPKVATVSQWEDLAERVKNAGGLPTTTTFWGRSYDASQESVSGDINISAGDRICLPFNVTSGFTLDGSAQPLIITADGARIIGLSANTSDGSIFRIQGSNNATKIQLRASPATTSGLRIEGVEDPINSKDAANKDYVDANGKVEKAGQTAWTSATLRYSEETGSGSKGALFPAGLDMSDEPFYVGIGASGTDTPADGYGPRPYLLKGHVSSSGAKGVVGKTRISLFAEMEDRILAGGTTAPTTSTVGKVGTLYAYVENGTGHLAICTDVTGGTYTWQTLI